MAKARVKLGISRDSWNDLGWIEKLTLIATRTIQDGGRLGWIYILISFITLFFGLFAASKFIGVNAPVYKALGDLDVVGFFLVLAFQGSQLLREARVEIMDKINDYTDPDALRCVVKSQRVSIEVLTSSSELE